MAEAMNHKDTRLWAYFFTAPPGKGIFTRLPVCDGKSDCYRVTEMISVRGDNSLPIESGWEMVRIETAKNLLKEKDGLQFKGTIQHLQYTSAGLRAELQRKSAPEFPAFEDTQAVLIPIRKTAAWWALPHDERQSHFERPAGRRTHSAIGADYADRVYRRLYHSRYLEADPPPPYDFLTYFEFKREDKSLFRNLLSELRDTKINPEWRFVEFETEIWMTKTEPTA